MINSLTILSLIFLPLASGAQCPLGAKETHLTVQRLMRNFGSYTLKADSLCLEGVNRWERDSITEERFPEAIHKLDLAILCAEEVLKDPTGDVLPSKISFIKDEKEIAELVDDYIYFMTDFKDGLIEYREIFKKLQAQKPAERNFEEANIKRQDLDTLVERAHRKL